MKVSRLFSLDHCFHFRTHQRSVEVARQRLEEYQRALQLRYGMAATMMPPPSFTHRLHSVRPVHPPAALPLHLAPAEPAHVSVKPLTSVEIPTRQSGILASPPHPPGSSSRVCSRLQPDESVSDVSAWLTDSIMDRVTEHLPEKVRPLSVTRGPLPNRQQAHHSLSIPLPSTSDPFQTTAPSVTDGPGAAADKPHGHVATGPLSPREDDTERRRRELEETKRRVLEQSEAVALQQRQLEEKRQRQEEEMKEMRRQKETLQALIHTDAQVSEGTASVLPSKMLNDNPAASPVSHSRLQRLQQNSWFQRTSARDAADCSRLC